ncbi:MULTISPECIES: anaerobic C4-dicarboxylate transporter family protein [Candidatus Cardinium]|uniref:anaerobic C4-dicarboxylate transporter family protein n=1 Tax=Candidatus Cardinium TaxID=273135 RepID=UPI001FAB0EFC|nr:MULTISPECIES: anaerobic C4-dicarboxylate transporter family protein [Cardinium]
MMITIGWGILLLLLIIGLRLGGISVGLFSGLGLGLSTFWVQPAAPPHDLMLLQATWLLLMATLETAGFFYLLKNKFTAFLEKSNHGYSLFILLLCYGLVFLTGDKKWLCRSLCEENRPGKSKARLIVALEIAAHMALLVSPLSMLGMFLIIVVGNSGLPILNLLGMMIAITIGITVASSLLVALIPEQWLDKLSAGFKDSAKKDTQVLPVSKYNVQLIFLLLLLSELLFLLIKPQSNRLTELSCIQKIFPVRFPMFFSLVMLAIGALTMLSCKIRPAQILQTCRFKLGMQQFFIFLGLTWLLNTLISYDKVYLTQILDGMRPSYLFYLVAGLCMLLIDLPILIWLFSPLLIAHHCTIVMLAVWLVFIHSLAPIRYCIIQIVQAHKKSR